MRHNIKRLHKEAGRTLGIRRGMTGATHEGNEEDTGADNDDVNRGILGIVVSEPVISRLATLNVEVEEEQVWHISGMNGTTFLSQRSKTVVKRIEGCFTLVKMELFRLYLRGIAAIKLS